MLVDGEHYPAVVRAAVEELRAGGRKIVGAALLGGSEKIAAGATRPEEYGVDDMAFGESPLAALLAGIQRFEPDEIVDLSDQPVLDARTRLLLAACALSVGLPYRGAGSASRCRPGRRSPPSRRSP